MFGDETSDQLPAVAGAPDVVGAAFASPFKGLAALVSVPAKLNVARSTLTEQRANALRTRGWKMPAWELGFFCM